MQRTYFSLKCACALTLATGIALIVSAGVAHSAAKISDSFCWANSAGSACTDLGDMQCAQQGGVGGCTYCDSTGALFSKTCVYCVGCAGCTTTGTTRSCGNRYTGTCYLTQPGNSYKCLGPWTASGTCAVVHECP